jgi:hypothetical protein
MIASQRAQSLRGARLLTRKISCSSPSGQNAVTWKGDRGRFTVSSRAKTAASLMIARLSSLESAPSRTGIASPGL